MQVAPIGRVYRRRSGSLRAPSGFFSYFSDVQQSTAQAANVVPFTQFASDITSGTAFKLPNYAFVVPNIVNDAHSCITGGTTDCN